MKHKRLLLVSLLVLTSLALIGSAAEAKSKELPKAKTAQKAFMGIYLQDIDKDTQEALDLKSSRGVLVEGVVDDSPADKAGLKEQDVILSFEGQKVDDSDQLRELLSGHKPGDEVEVRIIRDGSQKTIQLELGKSGDMEDFDISIPELGDMQSFSFSVPSFNRPRMGVQISDLTEQLGEFLGVKGGKGALITEVIEESPAEKAGLKAGDVIVRIGDDKIKSSTDVYQALEGKEKGEEVNVEVIRDKGTHSLTVTVKLEGPTQWHADNWNFKAPQMKQSIKPQIKVFTDQMEDRDDLQAEMKELQKQMKELQKQLEEMKEEK